MVTIIRGLPGSGKSTFARDHFHGILIVEADMFAMRDGKYCFDSGRLRECHWSAKQVASIAMQMDADVVITGTLTRKSEIEPYVNLATNLKQPYRVLHSMGNFGSIHSVPESVLANMRERWEKWEGETFVNLPSPLFEDVYKVCHCVKD